MRGYSAYRDEEWLFDVVAESSEDAFRQAVTFDPSVTHVDLVAP